MFVARAAQHGVRGIKTNSQTRYHNAFEIRALLICGVNDMWYKGIEPVVHSVRTAVKAGCKVVILTNACGAINATYKVGQPVLIRDHISLTAVSPLTGATFVAR